MPSVNSSSRARPCPSSTFTTPSLPTFSIASPMTSPISRSREETVATRAMSSLPETLLRLRLQVLDDGLDGPLDAALEPHRVRTGGDVLQALAHDRLCEHRRRRRAVACDVVRRRRDLAHELRTLVLEDVLDLDLASDRDAVIRDGRRAELLVQHDVATLRAKGDLDRVGEDVHAALESAPGILVELQLFVSHVLFVLLRNSDYDFAPAGLRACRPRRPSRERRTREGSGTRPCRP